MTTRYVDRFVPGDRGLLVLFHGTGGDEHQFIELGAELAPGWALLGVRGQVSEGGALRYFRRFAEGHLDLDDMKIRVDEVAAHVQLRRAELGLEAKPLAALGYSNGANVVAGLLNRHPGLLDQAVMWRPMDPLPWADGHDLAGTLALITASLADHITPAEGAKSLAEHLTLAGASVESEWVQGGHSLTRQDVVLTKAFFEGVNG